jgi:hypothetical protein
MLTKVGSPQTVPAEPPDLEKGRTAGNGRVSAWSCKEAEPSEAKQSGQTEEKLFCTICCVAVLKTSKHCRACDKCVDHFDHHCRVSTKRGSEFLT